MIEGVEVVVALVALGAVEMAVAHQEDMAMILEDTMTGGCKAVDLAVALVVSLEVTAEIMAILVETKRRVAVGIGTIVTQVDQEVQ